MEPGEPFILYVSKRFMDKASKSFGLGFLARKPMVEILGKMGVAFKELDRDEAKIALERIGESKGVTVSAGQLMKGLALALPLHFKKGVLPFRSGNRGRLDTGVPCGDTESF